MKKVLILVSLAISLHAAINAQTNAPDADIRRQLITADTRSGLENKAISETPEVEFPADAVSKGFEGDVIVTVNINADGDVTGVTGVSGPGSICSQWKDPDVLAIKQIARDAAMRAKFKPLEINGQLIASIGKVVFTVKSAETANSTSAVREADPTALAATDAPNSSDESSIAGMRDTGDSGSRSKTISGGVLNGKAISLPKPPYPAAARAVRASGTVVIQVLIDEHGDTMSAKAISGHPLLNPASVAAACSSKFGPTRFNGVPVKVSGVISYNFVP